MKEILVDLTKCLACRSCEIACALNRDSVSKNLFGTYLENPSPLPRVSVEGNERFFIPMQCRHCNNAPCLTACPSGALHRDSENNAVLVNQELCVGCWMCVTVCPFGAIKPHSNDQVVLKCDRCTGMEYPFCVEVCPTNALIFEDSEKLKSISNLKSKRVVEAVFYDQGRHVREDRIWDFQESDLTKKKEDE